MFSQQIFIEHLVLGRYHCVVIKAIPHGLQNLSSKTKKDQSGFQIIIAWMIGGF